MIIVYLKISRKKRKWTKHWKNIKYRITTSAITFTIYEILQTQNIFFREKVPRPKKTSKKLHCNRLITPINIIYSDIFFIKSIDSNENVINLLEYSILLYWNWNHNYDAIHNNQLFKITKQLWIPILKITLIDEHIYSFMHIGKKLNVVSNTNANYKCVLNCTETWVLG